MEHKKFATIYFITTNIKHFTSKFSNNNEDSLKKLLNEIIKTFLYAFIQTESKFVKRKGSINYLRELMMKTALHLYT